MAMISRRAFVAGSAAMMLAPLPSRAQHPTKPYRVGCLWPVPAPAPRARAALEAGLRDLGWHPGTDVLFEHRFADGQSDVAGLAASLVSARVNVITAFTPSIIAAAARATTEIPIVMVAAADPVGSGFAVSLVRPGKNMTGISASPDLLAKNLDILKDIAPGVKRVAILRNPDAYPPTGLSVTTLEATARALQLTLLFSDVRNRDDIERVARGLGQSGASAIFAMPDASVTGSNGDLIAVLALMHRLPALFGDRWPVVEGGGLASFGPERFAMVRHAASFVDRILRGARVGDLPIEQPAKVELVINLKTARALGLTIPQTLLIRANQIIE